jgi:menaquinol-cytochrome c reductase iron-sulfur subunit
MHRQSVPPANPSRRGFIVRMIQGTYALIGATLAFVVGGAVVAPSFGRRESMWLHAGETASLEDGTPLPITLRVARPDGPSEMVDRKIVYLVKTGNDVRALDSTCTHLGCRTRFNAESRLIECPCHGGVYDVNGQVVSGPPPEPLRVMTTRIVGGKVMVQV